MLKLVTNFTDNLKTDFVVYVLVDRANFSY